MLLKKVQIELLKNSYANGEIAATNGNYQNICYLRHTGFIKTTEGVVDSQNRYLSFSLTPTGEAYVEDILDKEQSVERESLSLEIARKSFKISSSARVWSIVAAIAAIVGVITTIAIAIFK